MRKELRYFIISLSIIFIFMFFNSHQFAYSACEFIDSDDINLLQQAQEDCQKDIDARMPAQNKNKEDLAKLEKNLATTKKLIQAIELQVNNLEKEILQQEIELEYQKEIFAARVRDYYKKSRGYSLFALFLASSSANDLFRELSYRQSAAANDKRIILEVSQGLKELNDNKAKLEANSLKLNNAKNKLDQDTKNLASEVKKVEDFFSQVESTIAALSAKQQALLAEKTGTFQTTVGEVPLADDPASRPDYNPGFSPAFAAFSFGAPHRKGMSQYGAFGRAKAGQSAEEILKAYYGGGIEIKKDYSTSININVQGYGSVDIETYTKRIYEMPGSWGDEGGMEALKAQAVAARSYALAYTNNGAGSICATESCQVYKPTNKGGKWEEAVNATTGWVLVVNGQPFSAWYASTAGGYTYSYSAQGYSTPGLWDTSCGNQGCWTSEAWEKKADSPWFYKGWYKSRSGSSCGRSHPWLTQEEMADILNAIVVYRSGQGAEHILPVDYNSCFGSSGDSWSQEQMRNEANSRGGAFSSISGVSTTYSSGGQTAKVNFSTNRGSFEVSGDEFYTVFNLRAPGRIALKSKLFNIEKK